MAPTAELKLYELAIHEVAHGLAEGILGEILSRACEGHSLVMEVSDGTEKHRGGGTTEHMGLVYGNPKKDGYLDWMVRCTLLDQEPAKARSAKTPGAWHKYLSAEALPLEQACRDLRDWAIASNKPAYEKTDLTPLDVSEVIVSGLSLLSPSWTARINACDEDGGIRSFGLLLRAPPESGRGARDRELLAAFWLEIVLFAARSGD